MTSPVINLILATETRLPQWCQILIYLLLSILDLSSIVFPEADGNSPLLAKKGGAVREIYDQDVSVNRSTNETKAQLVNNFETNNGSSVRVTSEQQEGMNVLAAIKECQSQEDLANEIRETENDQTKVKSSTESHLDDIFTHAQTDKAADKTGDAADVNGIDEEPCLMETDEKPNLRAKNEDNNILAIQQKESLSEERQKCVKVPSGLTSGVDLGKNEPALTNKKNHEEGSFAASTPVLDRKYKSRTSLELSGIPLEIDSSRESATNLTTPEHQSSRNDGHRRENEGKVILENNKSGDIEKGGKIEKENQSRNNQTIGDSIAADDESGMGIADEDNKNENKNKRKRNSENGGNTGEIELRVLVNHVEAIQETESDDLSELRRSSTQHKGEEERDEKPKKRRASVPDAIFTPLSPLMEGEESANTLLSPPGDLNQSGTKVKRHRSLVARGISKMFSSRRKYKVDKEDKTVAISSTDSENNTTPEGSDFKENRNEKKKKKEKGFQRKEKQASKRKSNEEHSGFDENNVINCDSEIKEEQYGKKKRKDKSYKLKDGKASQNAEEKTLSRKFGSLFSRSKK